MRSARVAWRHSLRFRLALVYTLVALALISMIGLGVMTLLLRQMDSQFQTRLNERADTLAEAFLGGGQNLGKSPGGAGTYTMIIDEKGQVLAATPSLRQYEKAPFPFAGQAEVQLNGSPARTATRKLGDFGTLWMALPEDALVDARQSATRALLLALLVTPVLMLIAGWWVGRRALADLGAAADLADRIDPTRSVATLPLPAREDEVHRLLAALNRLLVRIEAVQAREKQLLGQIVHELGAPLTVLKASLTRASERTHDPEVMRAALVADELTFTAQDLMQLARGHLEMKVAWHFIPAMALRGRLDRLVPGTGFAGDWGGMLLCDPDRLTQALRNLLANARRAAGPDGTVTLSLTETSDHVTFTVRDSGPGLPAELGERIFEPFISGSGSSGLGLSVARQIARLHGGALTAGNAAEGGAEFVLTLPGAALGDDEEEAAPAEAAPSA
ncbi:HAMP domain-containing histidine kinase [Deinococcus metallilatus]|uniref:histidine kinase n=1 Tax=Deinococcus metallilatus TaxID=1211322 RepID=A0AAJ5F6B2_9DEIO|nr:HAMP domain-containing sensor histidine kinase [Deinococcus metallilatus]MBB5294457.1 signal transduction histidine kinase [Deinococcus metallilatus]QBY10202.1 HAMP domain-containing histidine kinase [Deinococcus metallilatus]RXJ13928.1 HAMP domain-containing histidine kinase [Deinococcus metallilatus]TLK29893.1 HAMP domain-containing histidine kinase [Deinococcus metallilatus]GMA15673.1 two-component sensor histidine kinase [Deinococcus metallilatus]